MPQLVFPARPDGLFVDVLVGLSGATLTALIASGQADSAPLRARAVIDTGSDVTAVSTAILQQLGVPVQKRTTSQTASGTVGVNLFNVSVGITDFGDLHAVEFVEPDVVVMELTVVLPAIDVLIGLDMLLNCRFVLDGPGRVFTLDF